MPHFFKDNVELFHGPRRRRSTMPACRGSERPAFEVRGEVDGGLTAELNDRVVRLLGLDDAGHVLRGQRLKVQTVSGVEVGGNGLRVVVDDNGLAAELLQRPDRVNRAVVELDALTDTDRTGAENQNLLLAGRGATSVSSS